MKKTYRQIGLYFAWANALQNEFHNLGEYNSQEEAERNIKAADLRRYDYVIVVPSFEADGTTPEEPEDETPY